MQSWTFSFPEFVQLQKQYIIELFANQLYLPQYITPNFSSILQNVTKNISELKLFVCVVFFACVNVFVPRQLFYCKNTILKYCRVWKTFQPINIIESDFCVRIRYLLIWRCDVIKMQWRVTAANSVTTAGQWQNK